MTEKLEHARPRQPAPAEFVSEERLRAASLIESIPDMSVSSPDEVDDAAEDIDYGELIERELILPGREGSIFKESVDEPPRTDFEVLKEIMDDLGRLGPKKPSL